MPQTALIRKPSPYRKVENCSIIDLGRRKIYLNDEGTRIWELIDGQRTAEEIAQEATRAEGATPDSFQDAAGVIKNFLNDLFDKSLLTSTDENLSHSHQTALAADNSIGIPITAEACQYHQAPMREDGAPSPPSSSIRERVLQLYWDKQYIQKLHLELTYRCNLRCCHCYNSSHSGKSRELTTDQWINIMEEAVSLGCYFLTFTGGEPFARKDILEILQTACRLGFAFRISTNGSMIREKHVATLQNMLPFLQGVDISIYGATSQMHDKVTSRPGSYAQTKAAICSLLDARVPVVAKYVTMQMNFEGMEQFEEEMRAAAIPYAINTGSMSPRTDRNPAPLVQLLTDAQYRKLLAVRGHPKGGKDSTNCVLGWNYAAITADGFVSPCEWLVDLKLGNLREATLKEIWHGPSFQEFRDSVTKTERQCLRCELRNFCCSCPARVYLETGNLFGCAPVQRHNAEFCREFFGATA